MPPVWVRSVSTTPTWVDNAPCRKPARGFPWMKMSPCKGGSRPQRVLSRVLLPAPLLPSKAVTSPENSCRSTEVGVVLTERTQTGGISVYDLVSLGRYPHTGFFGTLREEDHAAVRRALETVGIADKAQRHISELSDGERQKAFIAKVLAQECPIILLDEPTAFLDVTSRMETMITLRRLAHREGKAILLSTHDLDTALQMADKLWLQPACPAASLENKENVPPMICGTPDKLVENGALARFFDSPSLRFDPDSRRLMPAGRKK